MTKNQRLSSKEIYDQMMILWRKRKRHYASMANQLTCTMYEIFGDFPPGISQKGRDCLKLTNDIEADLIRLDHKLMALHGGFIPISAVSKFEQGNEIEGITAIASYTRDMMGL